MSESKLFTFEEVAQHNTKKDLYVVVHGKVYDITKFIDEHPGGEEVLVDEAGKDATEAFEDIGHSDEARDILKGLYVGDLKLKTDDVKKTAKTPVKTQTGNVGARENASNGNFNYLLPLAVLVAYVAYKYYIGLQAAK